MELETGSRESRIGEIEVLEDEDRRRPAEKGTVACPPFITVEGGRDGDRIYPEEPEGWETLPEDVRDPGMDPCMGTGITRGIPDPPLPLTSLHEKGPGPVEPGEEWLDIPGRDAGIPGLRDIDDPCGREDLSCPEDLRDGGPPRAEMAGGIDVGSGMGVETDGARR